MTEAEEERRGAEVRHIIGHPIYKEAFAAIQDRIVSQLSLADTPDETRKRLNDLLIALHKVNGYLTQVMVTGTMAAQQIERKRTIGDRIRAVI